MKKTLLLLFAAAGLLAGCSSTPVPPVATHIDQFTGFRTDIIPENLLESPQDPPREMVWLNASRVYKNFNDFDYYLEVHYAARKETGLLDILPGNSLLIVADGEQMKFTGTGSLNTRSEKGDIVSEDALYEAGPNELRKIARGKKVQVSILGRNGRVEREFKPENSEKFQKFVYHFVEGHP